MSISIAIATFGDETWKQTASRAISSAENQTIPAQNIVHVHADYLHEARNLAAHQCEGDWIVFLDADDELDSKYLESMTEKISFLDSDLWLVQPSTLGIVDGREDPHPVVIPSKKSILDGNWMVIGTMVSKSVFISVGGFSDFQMYEDWDLWIRCIKFGCKTTVCEDAIYKVHVKNNSRNNQSRNLQISTYNQIRNQYI